jgi:hypothetical protein
MSVRRIGAARAGLSRANAGIGFRWKLFKDDGESFAEYLDRVAKTGVIP